MRDSLNRSVDRSEHLAAQRARLRARCEVERYAVRTNIENATARLESLDRGINAVRRVVTRPAFILGTAAVLAFIGPGRLFKLAGRGALLFNATRRFLPKRFVPLLPKNIRLLKK